jgi:hypothetical protein
VNIVRAKLAAEKAISNLAQLGQLDLLTKPRPAGLNFYVQLTD